MKIEPIRIPEKEEGKKAEKTELMKEFERETGKHAVWQGEITKQFKEWKKERRKKPKKKKKKKPKKKDDGTPVGFGGRVMIDLDEEERKPRKTKLMKKFEKETGKHAIWDNEITKQYEEWKKQRRKKPKKKKKKKPKKKEELTEKELLKMVLAELKELTEEDIIERPDVNLIKKQEGEWQKGPVPKEKRFAFEPTEEEREMMEEIESVEREKEVLKPTKEEEELMEQMREPDLSKEIEPTKEEEKLMKAFKTSEKLKPTKEEEELMEQMREPDFEAGPTKGEEEMLRKMVDEERKKRFKQKPKKPEKKIVEKKNRTRTGIKGIDELTNGGLPKEKAIAVVGGPGTGKSMFLMQFLVNGANLYDEPGVFITFEEKEEELKENFNRLNFNINELEKKGLLKIVHYSPMKVKRFIKNMDVTLRNLIKEMKAKRVVIDSLTAFTLLYETEGEQREGLFELFQALKKLGVTTLLSTESWREPSITKSGVIEFIADGVIMLYNLKIGDTRVRAVEVLKMRGIKHEARIVPFRIMNNGIKVFTEEEVFGGSPGQPSFEQQTKF